MDPDSTNLRKALEMPISYNKDFEAEIQDNIQFLNELLQDIKDADIEENEYDSKFLGYIEQYKLAQDRLKVHNSVLQKIIDLPSNGISNPEFTYVEYFDKYINANQLNIKQHDTSNRKARKKARQE